MESQEQNTEVEEVKTEEQTATYLITYVLQELGRDIKSEISKVFSTTNKTTKQQLLDYCATHEMIFERGHSTATNTEKIRITDYKRRCQLEAVRIK